MRASERLANSIDLNHKQMMGDVREIPLTRGLVAIVDAADYDALAQHKWLATSAAGRNTGYAARHGADGRTVLMHRHIMATPEGMCTDHINGNGLDNRRANLRVCTNAENLKNRRKAKINTSGFKGVTRYGSVWRVNVADKYIGCFSTPEEAALAYDAAARERYGVFANLNFPDRDGAPPPPRAQGIPDEKRLEILAAHYAGMPLKDAAKAGGVSRMAPWHWAKNDPDLVRRARIIALQTLLAGDQ